MKKFLAILVLFFLFSNHLFSADKQKADIEGLMFILGEANLRGEKINYDTASQQYGFKNFKDFVKIYSKKHEIQNLTVKEAKKFFEPADTSVEIVESQENLDKLHSLIINDKKFRSRTSYFKKKYKHVNKVLVVYLNYEKEMAEITKNPKLKKIGRFGFRFRHSTPVGGDSIGRMITMALRDCEALIVKKYNLSGGECIIVEDRRGRTYTNLLKPKFKKSNKKIVKKIVKKVPKDFKPVSVEDHIKMLGSFTKPTNFPKGMLKEFGKGMKSFDSIAIKSAQKMSLAFRRGDEYNQRHPGNIFYALAHFELFYQYQLKKKEKTIDRFLENWPEKKLGGKTIVTLLKFNKARKKMRESLGMNLNTSTEEAIQTFWTLGDYLEKGKIVKQKVHPDIKIRKKLLAKYKSKVKAFSSKIEQQKDDELYDQIYVPTFKKFKFSNLKRKKT